MHFTFADSLNTFWLVFFVGGVVFVLALLLGRLLFAGKTREQDQESLLDARYLLGITKDRRAAPRRKGNTVDVQLSDGSKHEPISGIVVDRSVGGLRILVDHPFKEGQVLKIRHKTASLTIPWTEVNVLSCKQDGAQYELGCQFRGTPNFNLLLQFG